jgi:hypothetical protein
MWAERAAALGNQQQSIIRNAQERGPLVSSTEESTKAADRGLTYARDRNFEREAVADERGLLRDTLRRSLGAADLNDASVP